MSPQNFRPGKEFGIVTLKGSGMSSQSNDREIPSKAWKMGPLRGVKSDSDRVGDQPLVGKEGHVGHLSCQLK